MGISYRLLSTVSAVRVIKKKKRSSQQCIKLFTDGRRGGKGTGNWQRQNCDHYCHFLQESSCQPENYARVTQEQWQIDFMNTFLSLLNQFLLPFRAQ